MDSRVLFFYLAPCAGAFADLSIGPASRPTFPTSKDRKDRPMSQAPRNPQMFYVAHPFVCVNVREPGHPRSCCAEKGSKELDGYRSEEHTSELQSH